MLIELQKTVQNEVRRLGFEIEARSFKPHATLGRVKKIPYGLSVEDEISKIKSVKIEIKKLFLRLHQPSPSQHYP